MSETLLIAGTFVLALIATIALIVVRRRLDRTHQTRVETIEHRLAETHSVERTHLERPPTLRELAVVDRTDDDRPVYVPIVRFDLGMTEAPSMDLVFEFVGSTLETVHPILVADPDVRIRHYDVQFTFGPSGLFVSRLCQRVSVPLELVDRLCRDAKYRKFDLQRDVRDGDAGDGETPPVMWGDCREYRRSDDSSDGAGNVR
ncbi:hypothetical protein ACLI4U_04405 [Natrialbaceae archaeon A-CW2]|uniref:hypothetical protein n=1 Tax=Natronosalvus amylolyticus TaxID=2961994 RepID=UPI0020C953B7|nr:hypothetical protein [Natronosalvus amylolyticus]